MRRSKLLTLGLLALALTLLVALAGCSVRATVEADGDEDVKELTSY